MPVEFEIKVAKVGNSLRITIPKEICKAMHIDEGSTVGMTLTNGEFKVRKIRQWKTHVRKGNRSSKHSVLSLSLWIYNLNRFSREQTTNSFFGRPVFAARLSKKEKGKLSNPCRSCEAKLANCIFESSLIDAGRLIDSRSTLSGDYAVLNILS